MEKDVLLATTYGFYYQGIPGQVTYVIPSKDTEEYVSSAESYDTLKNIETTLVFSQLIIVTLAVICIIKGIINSKKNKEIVNFESGLNGEESENGDLKRKATIPYFVVSIIFFMIYGIINVIEGFAINLIK